MAKREGFFYKLILHIYTEGSDGGEQLYEKYQYVPNSIKEFEVGFLETNRPKHINEFHLMSPKQKKVYLEICDKIEKNYDG